MTPQEQQMIDGLIQRIRGTQVQDKDLDAERYLQQGLAGSPDALYILAQTVLVQQYGLQQAQQQMQEMQAALDEARQHAQSSGGGGFLSKIFGGGAGQQTPQTPYQQQTPYQPANNPGYPPQGYPQQGYAQPGYAPVYGQPMGYGAGGGGFLRGALQTAAGVAVGEMAFESMESLFHGFGGGGGYERQGEVVNNYYGDASPHEHRVDDSNFYNPENDASRQDVSGQTGQDFADNSGSGSDGEEFSNDIAGSDSNDFADDSGADDSGFDDSGSNFDDGSGGGDGSF